MNSSAFRDICMSTSDAFKVIKIARAAGEYNLRTLKNIMNDHISRNAGAIMLFFLSIIFSRKL